MSRIVTALLLAGALLLTGASPAFAQQSVSGVVTDADTGDPLPGVNIIIQGTSTGTVTSLDGEYGLTVPGPEAVLVFSYVGYLTFETVVGSRTDIDVALEEDSALIDEVIVVGYGTQRRGDVTSSVASVDVDDANVGVTTNVDELIQGRVSGVQVIDNNGEPGGGVSVRIRGGTSISASNEPLYVVDGVPLDDGNVVPGGADLAGGDAAPGRNPLNLLNPNDIQSISVLKDAAATAIYGSRGANGVVLITTRSGVEGRLQVNYEGRTSFANASRTIDLVSGSEYEQFIRDRVADGQLGFDDDGNLVDVEGGNTPTVIINEDGEEETIFPNNQADVIDALGGTSTDFQDLLLRTAVSQQHNLSFSGGTANTQYRASLGYLNQEGIVISSGLERLTGRLNANTQTLGGRLRLGLNLTSAVTEDDFVAYESTGGFEGGLFTNLYDFNPTFPERDANGEFFELEGQTSIRNPVGVAEEISDAARTTRTLGNISADLDLIDGLTARVNLGGDRSVSRRQIYQPNSNPIGATFNGRAIQSDLQRTSITLQSYLTYDRQIAERNNLNLLAGYEFNEFDTEFFAVEGRGFLTDANGADNIGAATSFIPEGQGCEQTATSSCREKNRLISFFGRTNYNFDQKYYISASLRYDGSSRFGPENRWALFPAISGAWRVSSESFLADNDFLTDLRVKAGFGIVGNQSIPNYRTLLLLDPASDSRAILGGEVFTGFVSPFPPNLDLQWEEKQEFTAGIEYELLQGRFFGSLEFYRNTTDNLLLEVPAATPQLGDGQFLDNFGSLRNTGLDFALDAYAIDKSDMTLQIGVVFNTNSNEIVDLGSLTEVQTGTVSGRGQSGQNALLLREGESFPVFFGPEFAGFNDEGRQLYNVYDGDGNLTGTTTDRGQATNRIIGDPRPAFSYGLRTRFDYKQFGVSMFIRGEQGRELFNNTALIFETQSAAAQGRGFFADALDNPDAFDEAPTYSSRWIENASFLRLDNITLEYRPDMSIVTPLVQSARVFLSIDNVFTITPYSGYDPEVNTNAQVGLISATGVDYTNYPRPRTFTIGVNLGF